MAPRNEIVVDYLAPGAHAPPVMVEDLTGGAARGGGVESARARVLREQFAIDDEHAGPADDEEEGASALLGPVAE